MWLHVAALWAIAVAQPLFDLLGNNPEFFVAHRAGAADVLAVALALALLPPSLLTGLVWLAGVAGGPRPDDDPWRHRGRTRLPACHAVERSRRRDELAPRDPDRDDTRRRGGIRPSPPGPRADLPRGAVNGYARHPRAVSPETGDPALGRQTGRLGGARRWAHHVAPGGHARRRRHPRRGSAALAARCRPPDRREALSELRGVGRRRRLVPQCDDRARLHAVGRAVDPHGQVSEALGVAVGDRSPGHAVHALEPHAPDGSVGTGHRSVPTRALPARGTGVDRHSPSRDRPGPARDLPADRPDRRSVEEPAGSCRTMGRIRRARRQRRGRQPGPAQDLRKRMGGSGAVAWTRRV